MQITPSPNMQETWDQFDKRRRENIKKRASEEAKEIDAAQELVVGFIEGIYA